MNEPQPLPLTTPTGQVIESTLFEPETSVIGQLVIGGAMGVPQRFYRHTATFFASQGIRCLTFDYRGVGMPEVTKKYEHIQIIDWAREDLTTALRTLNQHAPTLPLYYLGHSLGGQIVGLSEVAPKITRLLMVASGVGDWRCFSPRQWPKMWLAWYLVIPLLLTLKGYLPGWLLGGNQNIPKGVVKQWRHWCLQSGYLWSDPATQPHYYEETNDALFIALSDDHGLAPPSAVAALTAHYPNAQLAIRSPSDIGVREIGHFGAFRPEPGKRLWKEWLAWLTDGVAPTP
ncbi:MAG: alpha/beta fold hydrolase [Gammaproteobacteria bacterium]|nr:MAG: alpha/beta fold hydrolase [Gammaproteobacteria bacterium]